MQLTVRVQGSLRQRSLDLPSKLPTQGQAKLKRSRPADQSQFLLLSGLIDPGETGPVCGKGNQAANGQPQNQSAHTQGGADRLSPPLLTFPALDLLDGIQGKPCGTLRIAGSAPFPLEEFQDAQPQHFSQGYQHADIWKSGSRFTQLKIRAWKAGLYCRQSGKRFRFPGPGFPRRL